MLNARAFANATTAVTAVFYATCWFLSSFAPNLIFGIAKAWMHSINIESLRATTSMSFGTILWGLISISLLTWVTTYAVIRLYNKWAGK